MTGKLALATLKPTEVTDLRSWFALKLADVTVTGTLSAVTLTADLFSDGDTFYAPSVGHGLTQASRFDGTASFYAPTVAHVAELRPSLVTNAAAFYAAEVMNQYPDPSSVLAGVVYGEPGLVFTGTYTAGFDGSLKLDVASGRMVKLLTNKVAITL